MQPPVLSAYRHEFGSILDLSKVPDFLQLGPEGQDLVLHLVAAHHGRARPHFPAEEVFDPEHAEEEAASVATEVPRRFARMQRKYGRWGLAFLESLVRAADIMASQGIQPGPPTSPTTVTVPEQGTTR
jgi:CRISPR-associated endonuclease/helicase Cas3